MSSILLFGRRVLCGGCGIVFFDRYAAYGPPYCCPKCEEEWLDARIDATARAQGFDSFDDWAAAGYPEEAL